MGHTAAAAAAAAEPALGLTKPNAVEPPQVCHLCNLACVPASGLGFHPALLRIVRGFDCFVSVPTTRLQQNLLILSCVDLIVAYVRCAKTSARSRLELAFSLLQNRTSLSKIYRFDPWEVSRFYPPEVTELQPVLSVVLPGLLFCERHQIL
jgi:hypothetical protein